MAVNLDRIHFYNATQPEARLANPNSGDVSNRSSQASICTDRDGHQAPGLARDFSNTIELSDDGEDQVAAVACLSTAKLDGLCTENAASSALAVPLAAASQVELSSARPTWHHVPATTAAVTPGDIFQPDTTGWLSSEAFQCGHSTALAGANIADIGPPADNQPEPVVDPVSTSPQHASQTVSRTSLGQIFNEDIDSRDDEPRTPIGRLVPGAASASEPDNENTVSDSSPPGQNGISPGGLDAPPDLFPILSSLSGLSGPHVMFRKKPTNPGHADCTATSLPPTVAPFRFRWSRSQPDGAISSPIDLPRGQDILPCGGAASPRDRGAKDPATSARWRANNLLVRPKSKPTRRSDPDTSGPQRRSARLRSAIRQAPPQYHEASDSCSDHASGSDENYISESADTERGEIDRTAGTDGPAPKRRRTLPFSTTVGAQSRSRPRPSWSSTTITSHRRARTPGIFSPPTSCEPSEPGSVEEGPVTTFKEWPLDRVTLKRVVDDGVATFQLQFSWDLCTKPGHHEKTPKTRRALPSEKRGPFTDEEDALLVELKEERRISWKEIHREFTASHPERSVGALQVRYCTKLKNRQT